MKRFSMDQQNLFTFWRDWKTDLIRVVTLVVVEFLLVTSSTRGSSLISQEVFVSEQGSSPLEARDVGLQLAEREALSSLLARIAPQEKNRSASLTDVQISGLIEDFEVFDEKQSPNGYKARVVFRFNKEGVEQLVGHDASEAIEEGTSQPVKSSPSLQGEIHSPGESPTEMSFLLIPVWRKEGKVMLWEDENSWRKAWDQIDMGQFKDKVLFPLGDLEDIQGVDAQKAWAADGEGSRYLAPRHHASQGALIARATLLLPSPGPQTGIQERALDVELLWDGSTMASIVDRFTVEGSPSDTEDSLCERGARMILDRLPQILAKDSGGGIAHKQKKTIRVLFSGPQEWFEIRKSLNHLKVDRRIESYQVDRLQSHEAEISIVSFCGNAQLQEAFRTLGLSFTWQEEDIGTLELARGSYLP